MNTHGWKVAVAAFTLVVAGCADEPTASTGSTNANRSVVPAQAAGPADPALQMRAALRGMNDPEFLAHVEKSQNIVMVGFKPEAAPWGVDERGRSLLSRAVVAQRLAELKPYAKRVVLEFEHIPAVAVELPNAAVALQLRKLPWVDYVAFNTNTMTGDMVSCFDVNGNPPAPAVPDQPQTIPWNITRVRASDSWSLATGSGASRAFVILDDGADEGGGPNAMGGPDLSWGVYAWYVPQTSNDGVHGTPALSAGTARNNSVGTVGVAPGARARVDKIVDYYNGGAWETWAAYAVQNSDAYANVITISYSTKQTSSTPPASQAGLYDAIKYAYYQEGVIITASTGNQSRSDYYAYPAQYAEVVGVGGSGYSDEWIYNNYAPGNVEISAPAVDDGAVCKGGATGYASGTSFATPMVAGAVMLLRERFPYISNDSLRARLRNTAVPMANTQQSGAGRMDVYRALTAP